MIVCKQCGHQNPDGAEFCEVDGVYLEWKGERVSEPAPPPEEQPIDLDEKAPEAPSLINRVKTAIGIGAGSAGSKAEGGAHVVDVPEAVPVGGGQPTVAAPEAPITPEPSAPSESGGSLGARLPGEEYRSRPTNEKKAQRAARAQPGDLICGQCGEPNEASRHFCQRCGKSLANATVATRLPWWRRLFRRKQKVMALDEEAASPSAQRPAAFPRSLPRLKKPRLSVGGRLRQLLGLAVVVALLAGVVLPAPRGWVTDQGKRIWDSLFGKPGVITVIGTLASSDVKPGHVAANATDQATNTSWWAQGNDSGEWLIASFQGRVHLVQMGLLLGDQDRPQDFGRYTRPRRITIQFCTRKRLPDCVWGTIPGMTLEPEFDRGTRDEQTRAIDAKDVYHVRLTVAKVWKGTLAESNPGKDHLALAGVEFFGKTD